MGKRKSLKQGGSLTKKARVRARYYSCILRYVAQPNDPQGAKDFTAKVAEALKDLKLNNEKYHGIKFVGQLEKGKARGLYHVQMMLYFPNKPDASVLRQLLADALCDSGAQWPSLPIVKELAQNANPQIIALSPVTDGKRAEALERYCLKTDETQIPGTEFHWNPNRYSGEDLEPFYQNPLSWQKQLYDLVQHRASPRHIVWIYDKAGKSGKTILVKTLLYEKGAGLLTHGGAQQLCTAALDFMANASVPITKWLIDLPRTNCAKNSTSSMYNTIEYLKNGMLSSSMYGRGQIQLFNPPHVVVFSNSVPTWGALTPDRWQVYKLVRGPAGPHRRARSTVGDITEDIHMVQMGQEEIIRVAQAERMTQQGNSPAQVALPPPRSYPNPDGTQYYQYPPVETSTVVPETDFEIGPSDSEYDSDFDSLYDYVPKVAVPQSP
jgi:hypothetical protein